MKQSLVAIAIVAAVIGLSLLNKDKDTSEYEYSYLAHPENGFCSQVNIFPKNNEGAILASFFICEDNVSSLVKANKELIIKTECGREWGINVISGQKRKISDGSCVGGFTPI